MSNPVVCLAVINKVQTTIDGGARITIDINEQDKEAIKWLLDHKLSGNDLMFVSFVEHENE